MHTIKFYSLTAAFIALSFITLAQGGSKIWLTIANSSNIPYTNDVLLDPYVPPLRDNRYLVASRDVRGAVPINVPTQGVD